MDPELRRQLDLESTERFIREQKQREKDLDAQEARATARAMAEYEELCKRDERQEQLAHEKEKKLWAAKDRIRLTPELSEYICRRVASGEMLKAICAERSMPTFELVNEWFDDPSKNWFHKAYMRATTLRDRAFEDDIVMIADDSSNDYIEKQNTKSGETFRVIDPEALTRSKMRIDARLRIMKANNPGRWGDNPNAGEATRELLKNMRPVVNISFIEAPKNFVQGDDAKVIEHRADDQIGAPPINLDKEDLDYIRRRDEKLKAKVA